MASPVCGCYMLGLGVGAILVGALGKAIHIAFYIAAPFALVPVVPLLMRPEDSLPGDRAGTTLSPTFMSGPAAGKHERA